MSGWLPARGCSDDCKAGAAAMPMHRPLSKPFLPPIARGRLRRRPLPDGGKVGVLVDIDRQPASLRVQVSRFRPLMRCGCGRRRRRPLSLSGAK